MKAVYLTAKGDLEALVYGDVARPTPAAGEVLVRVHSAAVTPSELDWRTTWETYAHQPRRFPIVLGHEFSGVVAALGPGVAGVTAGDPVYGVNDFISSGAQAEYVVAKAGELAPKPQTLDHIHAAVVPISALTAWQGLFDHGDLQAKQRVLIQGAAGAVGSFALQLARWRRASGLPSWSFPARMRASRIIRWLSPRGCARWLATQRRHSAQLRVIFVRPKACCRHVNCEGIRTMRRSQEKP